jgi:hypothetical protein
VIATFDAILAYVVAPTPRRLALASGLTLVTLWSRASLGVGPLVALGLVLAVQLLARRWRWLPRVPGNPFGTAVAIAIPVGAYCALNYAKFHRLLSVPWEHQVYSGWVTERIKFLESNHNSFFGLKFLVPNLWQYLRPTGFSLTRLFPWFDFPAPRAGVFVGGVRFDTIDVQSSITASLPLFVVLFVVGAVVLARTRGPLVVLWIPAIGAVATAGTVLVFGYLSQRYTGDFLPGLLVLGLFGFQWIARWVRRHPSRRQARAVVAALVVLGLVTVWANFALALFYQRVFSPDYDEGVVASFVDLQQAIGSVYSSGALAQVETGVWFPPRGHAGELFIVGDCAGLYLSTGLRTDEIQVTNWRPVERTNGVGRYLWTVRFPERAPGTREPLLGGGTPADPAVMFVKYLRGHHLQFSYDGAPGPLIPKTVHFTPGKAYTLDISADAHIGFAEVKLDGSQVAVGFYPYRGALTPGRNEVDPRLEPAFTGTLQARPLHAPVCEKIRRRAGLAS